MRVLNWAAAAGLELVDGARVELVDGARVELLDERKEEREVAWEPDDLLLLRDQFPAPRALLAPRLLPPWPLRRLFPLPRPTNVISDSKYGDSWLGPAVSQSFSCSSGWGSLRAWEAVSCFRCSAKRSVTSSRAAPYLSKFACNYKKKWKPMESRSDDR